jgi:hypothetical protein
MRPGGINAEFEMPELEYFTIAQSVSIDQSTNRISLFHVLEDVGFSNELPPSIEPGMLPRGIPQLVAVSSWKVSPQEFDKQFQVGLRIRNPGEQEFREIEPIVVTGERRRQRILQTLMSWPITGAGDILFELTLDGVRKASHVITAELVPLPDVRVIPMGQQDARAVQGSGS